MPAPEHQTVTIHGPSLRHVRRRMIGITPARLAAEVDVSVGHIRKLELGHVRVVSIDLVRRLGFALRLDDYRVLLADPVADGHLVEQATAASPARPADVPDSPDPVLDAADAIDEALDAPDPVDEALDAPDPADEDQAAELARAAS